MAEKPPSPHLFADVLARVHAICAALAAEGNWPAGIDFSRVVVEPPRDATHGDMATNAAMVLAKEAQAKPRDLAEKIAEKLRADDADRGRRCRRTRLHQSDPEAAGLGGCAAHGAA